MSGQDDRLEGAGLAGSPEAIEIAVAADVTTAEVERAAEPLFDRATARLAGWWDVAITWLPLALAIGISPGLFVWPLVLDGPTLLLDNTLPVAARVGATICVGASLLLMGALYFVAAWRADRPWTETFRLWNERLLPLLILPVVPLLALPGVESKKPWFMLIAAAGIALVAGLATFRRPLSLARLPSWLPGAMAVLFSTGWAVQIAMLAIGQHHALETEVYDLGIYDSIFWHSIHGEPLASDFVRGGNHITGHVDPILILLSPLYLIYPRAESILVLQAVWLALGAIPIWLLGKRLLGSWYALGFVAVYLLQPSLQGRALYHFHSLTLAGPLLLWCLVCLELGWLRRFWIALVLLLLTREDMALLGAVIGAYAFLGKGHRRLGVTAIATSLVYLAFVKLVVMPDPSLLMTGSGTYGFSYYYKDMIPDGKMGTTGLVLSLVTNPVFVLQHVLTEPKLRFFAIVFLPLLMLPLFAPRGRLLLLYGFAFIFLASRYPVYSPGFQYATTLDAFAIGLAIIALADLQRVRFRPLARLDPLRARPALMVAMVAASVVVSWKFGALVPSEVFRAGFHKLVREPSPDIVDAYAWIRKTAERIGPDASVSASSKAGPHLSNRSMAYLWPDVRDADYIVIDRHGLKGDARAKLTRLEKDGKYQRVDEHKRFILLERSDRLPPLPAAPGLAPAGRPAKSGGTDRGAEVEVEGARLAPTFDRRLEVPRLQAPRQAKPAATSEGAE